MENDDNTVNPVENTEVAETETPSQPKKPRKARGVTKKKLTLDNAVAVQNEPEPARFVIANSMTRPNNPPVNTIVYETDTGHRVQFDGTVWNFIDKLD